MNERNTAGRLGFIKDSEGVYRKGNFVYKEGKIMRESQIVPKGTIEDLKEDYITMDECIRSVLAYSTTIGDVNPRATNVYIDKVGENYKPAKSLSKNTVAIVMSNRQVVELKPRDVIEQSDSKELANKDEKDKPKTPKAVKEFGKPKKVEDLKESSKKKLNESNNIDLSNYQVLKLIDGYNDEVDGIILLNNKHNKEDFQRAINKSREDHQDEINEYGDDWSYIEQGLDDFDYQVIDIWDNDAVRY